MQCPPHSLQDETKHFFKDIRPHPHAGTHQFCAPSRARREGGAAGFRGPQIIQEQTESPVLKKVIDSLIEDTNNGKFLADGLGKYEYLFGDFFMNIVRVGESSGTLAKNLLYLADELRRQKSLDGKVKSAMVYPMVILVMTIGIAGFLTFFIFPKLIPVSPA